MAIEEAREALDRAKGRPGPVRHAPPEQLVAAPGDTQAAGHEVLFGAQAHPRAQALLAALQRGSGSLRAGSARGAAPSPAAADLPAGPTAGAGGAGSSPPLPTERAARAGSSRAERAERSTGGAAAAGPGAGEGAGAGAAAVRGPPGCVPAWPELLDAAAAGAADVEAVGAADALGWLRALARGAAPVGSWICLCARAAAVGSGAA